MTTAHDLTEADLGRLIRYRDGERQYEVRVASLARTRHGDTDYVQLAHGHEVRPPMVVELLPDDRVTGAGWWPDMPEDTYYSDPVTHLGGSLSASMCKTLVKPGGPAKLREKLDHPEPPKTEFDVGHAAHKLVLGVGAEIVSIPGNRNSKDVKAAIEAARDAGKVVLKPEQYDMVHAMADALANSAAVAWFDDTMPEVSAFRQHESGLWLRSRFDAVGSDYLVDYKTAATADPDLFARDAAKWGYHLQAAFYLDMAAAVGLNADRFVFIVQEKTAPYLASIVELSLEYLAIGRDEVARAIDLWQECTAAGVWPGYPDEPVTIHPPAWLRARQDESLDPAIEAAFADLLGETA